MNSDGFPECEECLLVRVYFSSGKKYEEGKVDLQVDNEMFYKISHNIYCLAGFYGISNILGYSKPNLVYTYNKYIWFGNTFCW